MAKCLIVTLGPEEAELLCLQAVVDTILPGESTAYWDRVLVMVDYYKALATAVH